MGSLAATGLAVLRPRLARAASYPFMLGVASGEPASDGFVIWTRLAPSPLNADGLGGMSSASVDVEWQVSADANFTRIVRVGTTTAVQSSAHTVRVVLTGLDPAREYWYRFRAAGQISPEGRAVTAPAPGTSPELTMLFASCSHFETGYFTAYRRMAEENPHLILHLGDYIYEGAANARVRQHVLPTEAGTLAEYRVRHAQYKTDPDLQAAHAAAPWVTVWDDHEVENNYANLARNDGSPSGDFRVRRAAAYRAYYEHMPLRPAQAPVAENMQLYRRVRWGSLATFHMLDTRQYRTDQACLGGNGEVCPAADDPGRTLTGSAQEAWLLDGMRQRLGIWDVLGQQVFFAQRLTSTERRERSMDSWDGYTANRDRIQRAWDAAGLRNTVVLTGDVHRAWACNLMLNYDTQDKVIGTELVATSVSSDGDGDGNATDARVSPTVNPHIKFFKNLRGYIRTRISAARIVADFRTLDKVSVPDQPIKTAKTYVVEAGNPGLST